MNPRMYPAENANNDFEELQYFYHPDHFDGNGNMNGKGYYISPHRSLCWDEENRLNAVGGYTGETYTGRSLSMYLYNSEGERVASKIGSGFGVAPIFPHDDTLTFINGDASSVASDLAAWKSRQMSCVGYTGGTNVMGTHLAPAENENNDFESNLYFYHPDHLGSANYITDRDGNAVQHLLYMPFGELFVSEETGDFDSRYKFSGKELDDETGYNYFGARYYDNDLSNWLSVDPMSDKYPSLSPYMYVAGNPVRLIDPDGKDIHPFGVLANNTMNELANKYGQLLQITYNEHTNVYGTNQSFINKDDFISRLPQGTNLSNQEINEAYNLYLGLVDAQTIELEELKTGNENQTVFIGNEGFSIVGNNLQTDNSEFNEFIDQVLGNGALTDNKSEALFKGKMIITPDKNGNKLQHIINSDKKGSNWVFFKNNSMNEKIKGVLILNGTNKYNLIKNLTNALKEVSDE